MELSGANQCTGISPHCILRYTFNSTMIENIYKKNSEEYVSLYEDALLPHM